jgi:hypothetical protein
MRGNDWMGNPQATLLTIITLTAIVTWDFPRGEFPASLAAMWNILRDDVITKPDRCQTFRLRRNHWQQTIMTSVAPFERLKVWRTFQKFYAMLTFLYLLCSVLSPCCEKAAVSFGQWSCRHGLKAKQLNVLSNQLWRQLSRNARPSGRYCYISELFLVAER